MMGGWRIVGERVVGARGEASYDVGSFVLELEDEAAARSALVARATIALHPAVSIGRDVVGREVGHQMLPQGWCGVCDVSRAFFLSD